MTVRHVLTLLALLATLLQGSMPIFPSDGSIVCGQALAEQDGSVDQAAGDACCLAGRLGADDTDAGEEGCNDPCSLHCPCCKSATAGNLMSGVAATFADLCPVGEVIVGVETPHLSLSAIPQVPPPRV